LLQCVRTLPYFNVHISHLFVLEEERITLPGHLILFPFLWRGRNVIPCRSTWCYSRSCGEVGTYYPAGAPDVISVLMEGFPEHPMLFPFLWRGSRSIWCYSRSCGGVLGAPDVIPLLVEGFPEHLMLFPFLWRGKYVIPCRSTWCYSRSCGGVPVAPDVIPVLVEGFPEHLMLFPFLWRGSRSTWCYSRSCGEVAVAWNFVFYVVFSRSLFVFLSFFALPLYFLCFEWYMALDIRLIVC
jgi:hypothetical protein